MEGPALKRPKLQLADLTPKDWDLWSHNLEILQQNLPNGCLCNVGVLELQRPIFPPNEQVASSCSVDTRFLRDYSLQFISTIHMLIDTALKQQFNGFICKKILDMSSELSMDEGSWEMLIGCLDSTDKFVTAATSKCLVSLLMWTRLPNLNEIIDELFNNVMITTDNPLKLSHILDVIRGVVEYKYISEPPIFLQENDEEYNNSCNANDDEGKGSLKSSDVTMTDISPSKSTTFPSESTSSAALQAYQLRASCPKIEVDTEIIENEVKTLCVKALENWWTRLLTKFQVMMAHFEPANESPIVTFLELWLGIISGDNSISVIDTKHYYLHLEAFVPLLNPNSPPIIWSKLTDVFNEVLCYGRTLALQDVPSEEPCDLAHLIIRCVRSRQFLQGIPFTREFSGFGGSSCVGPVDWECKSESHTIRDKTCIIPPLSTSSLLLPRPHPSSSILDQSGIPLSSKSLAETERWSSPSSSYSTTTTSPGSSSTYTPVSSTLASCSTTETTVVNSTSFSLVASSSSSTTTLQQNQSIPSKPRRALPISQTVYIGPSINAVQLDESFDATFGNRPLLQKVVLLVLKSVAVTVQETRVDDIDSDEEETSSMDETIHSGSESEVNDMVFVENSIRDVFRELDLYVKSVQPFHPAAPLGEWIIKLFVDQDDALIEAMMCTLDSYRGFHDKMEIPADFKESFHPVKTFVALLGEISNDNTVILDWLRGAETPHFLTYFLYFLKFVFKNWPEFVSSCGRDLENTMSVLIRLRMSVGRLTERGLWPYNINPVLRLLERCEGLYENDSNSSS